MKSSGLRDDFLSWFWVTLCTLAIFVTVPIARSVQEFFSAHTGRSFFGVAVLLTAGATFVSVLYFLYIRLKIRAISNYVWLTVVFSAYVYFTIRLWENPEEAVHFIEYGILGYFLFRAFRHHIDDKSIYLAAFLAGSLVGIFDEILQWIVPGRYWDFRDVGLNAISSGLFQIFLWKGIQPELPSAKIPAKSVRIISGLIAANLILFGLCFSNRSDRVLKYTEIFPFLSGLKQQEAMSETRYKHKDPEVGIFYSRLTLEDLKRIDTRRAREYGSFLRNRQNKDYAEYLKIVPGYINPFLHEIRVHIFRRDKKYDQAAKTKNPEKTKDNFLIAYKENLILEKYFGRTLAFSPYKWDSLRLNQVAASIDKAEFYKSPVSKPLFAFMMNELMIWVIITAALFFLLVLNLKIKKTGFSAKE